jgi:hypothetical protein
MSFLQILIQAIMTTYTVISHDFGSEFNPLSLSPEQKAALPLSSLDSHPLGALLSGAVVLGCRGKAAQSKSSHSWYLQL